MRKLEMREFTKNDWYAYSGAECFDGGINPMICEYGEATVIADVTGIQVIVGEEESFMIVYCEDYADREYLMDVCESILQELPGKTKSQMKKYLKSIM